MTPIDLLSSDGSPVSGLFALRQLVAAMRPAAVVEPSVLAPLQASPRKVIAYDHRGLERFDALPGEDSKRENPRRKLMIKRLIERGPERSLGAWPSDEMFEALEALKISHPNFLEVTEYVIGEAVLAMELGRAICGLRLLFSGPPGIGKSDYAMALSQALGLPLRISSMSAASSGFEISGVDEGWSSSRPGMVFEEIVEGPFANPIFLLDEIDKVSERNRDAVGGLYQLFETNTARVFRDRSVPFVALDTSHVNWLLTANEIDEIEPALLSRFHHFEIALPSREQYAGLIQRLYQQTAQGMGLAERFPAELPAADVERLLDFSAREIKRVLRVVFLNAVTSKTDGLRFEEAVLKLAGNTERGAASGFQGGRSARRGSSTRAIGFIWPNDPEVAP